MHPAVFSHPENPLDLAGSCYIDHISLSSRNTVFVLQYAAPGQILITNTTTPMKVVKMLLQDGLNFIADDAQIQMPKSLKTDDS